MKKLFLFVALSLVAASYVSAQLKVETSGNVKISKNVAIGTATNSYIGLNLLHVSTTTTPYYGIQSVVKTPSSMPTSSIYGVYGYADAYSLTIGNQQLGPIVGVFGKAKVTGYSNNNFSAGVAGMAHYYGGIGVYGGIGSDNMPLPNNSLGGPYSAYFAGNVKVTSTLTAAAVTTTSDSRLKDDIQYISRPTIDLINLLRPVTYKFKQDSIQYVYLAGAKEMDATHYGLVAQDVQQIIPDIVYEGGNGYLSVNYTEIVPLLVKSIQELSDEVNKLKALLNQEQH